MSESKQAPSAVRDQDAELRVGVYVCRCGGNISDVIDVERVAETARLIPGVTTAMVHTFMCSDPGQQAIQEDIQQKKLNRVVVASCSPFLHELTFRGTVSRADLNPFLYEHVNIREQGSWSHPHDPEGATQKAIRLIAAAVGKLRHAEPLEKIRLPNHRTALIVGGGIAGMKAAQDLANRGVSVLLVEQSDRLGGMLNRLDHVFPTERPGSELVDTLAKSLTDQPAVEILHKARVTDIAGFIGNYSVTIAGDFGPGGQAATVQPTVGAIIVATGFEPYEPRRGEYGYEELDHVLTMPQFVTLMKETDAGAQRLVHAGRAVRSIAFIHCVGSRQVDGVNDPQPDGRVNDYCSRVCCTTTLQQALHVKRRFPDIQVFDLHQDIRTYGRGHEDYYIDASKAGVVFFRWHGEEPPAVTRNDGTGRDAPLKITVKDWLTWGEEVVIPADLVVLATGMMPGKIADLIDMLKLPVGEDRFLQEVHPKLRPVEVSVNGVLLAGTSQGPMNIDEALVAGSAAAVKASAILSTEHVELNPFVAVVDPSRCDGSEKCIAECEYTGALTMVEKEIDGRLVRHAEVNPGLCKGCGACVALCPSRAIDLMGWTLPQYDAMVDGLVADVPEPAAAATA